MAIKFYYFIISLIAFQKIAKKIINKPKKKYHLDQKISLNGIDLW
jgi:hypothetical protein